MKSHRRITFHEERYSNAPGEVTTRDYLGEGMSIRYFYTPQQQRVFMEIRGKTSPFIRIDWSEEYGGLIERDGALKEHVIRQMLSWKDAFYSMVVIDYPVEKQRLDKIFSALQSRCDQLSDIRESAKKSSENKSIRTKPKKAIKKRGK